MRFDTDEEQAFGRRRDEIGERFARWLAAHKAASDPDDAVLLMDWKFGYGDGALDVWTVADVREFLLDWCPRKLSAPAQLCARIPASVTVFVDFLAHTGLLAPAADPPSAIRRFCEQNTGIFLREMADPRNFGLAKRMFAGFDGSATAGVEQFDDEDEPVVVGPVCLPSDDERLAAIRAADVPRQLRLLSECCAAPGRPLTTKGNLRLADARHLVALLETGDDPELGGYRRLQSAEDLPMLSWLVDLALEAGVVRRQRGRLLAVARPGSPPCPRPRPTRG